MECMKRADVIGKRVRVTKIITDDPDTRAKYGAFIGKQGIVHRATPKYLQVVIDGQMWSFSWAELELLPTTAAPNSSEEQQGGSSVEGLEQQDGGTEVGG